MIIFFENRNSGYKKPAGNFKTLINGIMKTVVEKMANEEKSADDVKMESETDITENPEKLGPSLDGPITIPFPIGAYAKGLMLKGEKNPHLVLQCKEKPTVILLKKVSQELQAHWIKLLFW